MLWPKKTVGSGGRASNSSASAVASSSIVATSGSRTRFSRPGYCTAISSTSGGAHRRQSR